MIHPATPTTGDLSVIPLTLINTNPQIRTRNGFDEESLTELAATIKQRGLLQPLVVRPSARNDGSFDLIAGERRLLACSMAGFVDVPVMIRTEQTDLASKLDQAIENLQRVDLCLSDRAAGVATIVAEIGARPAAKMLGKSPTWISKHMTAARLPETIRLAAHEGGIEDLEILIGVHALGNHKATPIAQDLYRSALAGLADGSLSRPRIRELLDQANHAPDDGDDKEPEDGDEDQAADVSPAKDKEKFGKLELAESTAKVILAALEYTQKHKASSRPGEAAVTHVRDFIAKTWPKE